MKKQTSTQKLLSENEDLRARLDEAKETLRAIRNGEVDALIISGVGGEQVFSLKGADRFYRVLIEDMNEGALTLTPQGLIMYANQRFANMLKTPLDKVIGSTIHTWVTPSEIKISQALLRQDAAQPPSRGEVELLASDGTLVPVYFSITFLQIDEEQGLFFMVATDLTEQKSLAQELLVASNRSRLALLSVIEDQKLVEEKLRESGAELKEAQRVAQLGSWDWDTSTDTFTLSEEYSLMLGADPKQHLIGYEEHLKYYTPESSARLVAAVMNSRQTGEGYQLDLELVRLDGTRRWIASSGEVKHDANGQFVGFRGTAQNITERKQAEEEIRIRTDELATLYQLSRSLADANDLEGVIELVDRHAVESVHVTFACLALLEDGDLVTRAVYPVRSLDHDFNVGGRQPIAALPNCQRLLDKNEPVILHAGSPELGSLERTVLLLDFAQSVCLVPLRVGETAQGSNQALGLLILSEVREEKREPFTPGKVHLARSIGDQAAVAIRRLMLREQAGRRLQQLTSLGEIDRTIASNFDLRLSLQTILKHVVEQLVVDAADVLVFNPSLQILEFAAGRGFRFPANERSQQRMGEGQAGKAVLERHIVQIPDVVLSGAAFAQPELLKGEDIAAYIAVPLITKGEVKGVMEIYNRTPLKPPGEEWLDFLNTLAGQAAIAIDNVQMFDSLQRSNTDLGLAYDATIEGWSHALDLRDKETEGHTQRVAEMTVKLARTLGLSEEELAQVRWGGLLHDIGKMGVPDGILLKPGPLTDEEWVIMKKHPTFAYEMLSPIRYLHAALDIPYCHHEKWDGTGYPRGLKGEQIPLTARIFAVVDVWDALLSDRPYRPAWLEEKVRQHIQAGAGTHFDPQVVKTFLLEHGE